jgi:hypothetical protein
MKRCSDHSRALVGACAALAAVLFHSAPASAHCDGVDGPVVQAAQEALLQGDVNLVLIWVGEHDEGEIRRTFDRAMNVREESEQARELADTHFFETVVRLHRAGEGAPFTGLEPAGRDLGPAIPAADEALKAGDVTPLIELLVDQLRRGISERYERAAKAKNFGTQDIDAGREYVESYVTFMHYVEGAYEAATRPVEGHYPEGGASHHEK